MRIAFRNALIATATAGLLVAMGPVALGQQTPTCEEATAAVVVLQSDRDADLRARDAAQAQLDLVLEDDPENSAPRLEEEVREAQAQLISSETALASGVQIRDVACAEVPVTTAPVTPTSEVDRPELNAPVQSDDSLDVRPDTSDGVATGDGSSL